MAPHYSKRLDWSLSRNALTQAIEKRQTSGHSICDLTQSNPTEAGIPYPPFHEWLADPRILRYEPTAHGLLTAREAVAEYYRGTAHLDRILLTASTSEAYSYLFKLLCDPGDEILVPRPSYPLFDMLAQLESVRVTHYPLHYHEGWFIDIAALQSAITPRTRAVVWVNPNNPTGSYLKRSEYAAIACLCSEKGLALISDEVFADYSFEENPDALRSVTGTDACLSFSLSGLSKVCGMPQMKLGWIVASGPGHEEAVARLEWIADTFLSVGAPVQCAAPALLQSRDSIQRAIRTRTSCNLASLHEMRHPASPWRVLRVEGGWYVTLQPPNTKSEEERTLQLLDSGVLVQPGFFFDFESEPYLVISLLTEPQTFVTGVKHILNAC